MSDTISKLCDQGTIHEHRLEIEKLEETTGQYLLASLRYFNRMANFPQTIEFYEKHYNRIIHDVASMTDLCRYEYFKAMIQTGRKIEFDVEEKYINQLVRDKNPDLDVIREFYSVAYQYNFSRNDYRESARYLNLIELNSVEYDDYYWYFYMFNQTKIYLITGELKEAHKNLTLLKTYTESNVYYKMRYHNLNAEYLSRTNELLEAKYHYHEVLGLYEIIPNKLEFAFALKNLSIISRIQGNFNESMNNIRLAKSVAIEIENKPLEMSLRVSLGSQLVKKGDIHRAIEEFTSCIEYFQSVNDRKNVVVALGNLGVCYTSLGELQKAKSIYSDLLSIYSDANPKDKLVVNFNLAHLCIRLNELDTALVPSNYVKEILQRHPELENYSGYATYLDGLRAVKTGRYEEAEDKLKQASQEFEFTNKMSLSMDCKFALSRLGYILGQYYDSIRDLRSIIDYHKESDNTIGEIYALFLLFQIYLDLDDEVQLSVIYHEIVDIAKEYPSVALRQQVAGLVLQQKIQNIDLSAEILATYNQIEKSSHLDTEFYLFVLSHQATYLLNLYTKSQNCELLMKFSDIIQEIYDLYSTNNSPVMALHASLLSYQYAQIMGNTDDSSRYKNEVALIASKNGLAYNLRI